MRIVSVNVGVSREVVIKNRLVQTGIHKVPVVGRIRVARLGLQDDTLVEARKMGREFHAVYAYPHEHYVHWERELGRAPFAPGQFGENLTVTGLLEHEVRIGDVLRVGRAVLQVMQPRIPCAKLNQRMGLRFSPMFLASRKVGYYLRVLEEGEVGAGDAIEVLEREPGSPTMEEFVRLTQYEYWDAEGLARILQHARDLMPAWREIIEAKLERARAAVGWHGLREFEIVRREPQGADLVSLYLQCARRRPLAPFHGGQYLTVVLGGRSAHQSRRAYALSGDPQDPGSYRITVRRLAATEAGDPEGLVSSHLLSLPVGEHVLCTAPRGTLTPATGREGQVPVLLSQGLGLAPMVSILHEFAALKVPVFHLYHEATAGDPQQLLQEAAALVQGRPGYRMESTGVVGGHAPACLSAEWIGTRVSLERSDFYLAGTRGFTERLADELRAAGVTAAALHAESFG
ncbi:MAG: MOSC domain-containing protein, partial [Hylemonella sp.]